MEHPDTLDDSTPPAPPSPSIASAAGVLLAVLGGFVGVAVGFMDITDETSIKLTTAAIIGGPFIVGGCVFGAAGMIIDALRHRD